jgi:hypothetical protein
LDQAKSAVLNSLTSADAQRGYRHAIEEFVEWYPRLGLAEINGSLASSTAEIGADA